MAASSEECKILQKELLEEVNKESSLSVYIDAPPSDCLAEFREIYTPQAVLFVAKLVNQFNDGANQLYLRRKSKILQLQSSDCLPDFPTETINIREDPNWRVATVPDRVKNRKIDCGDVSPTNLSHLKLCLNSQANGIQVDFDDGHCPSYKNQLRGFSNIKKVVLGDVDGIPPIEEAPILMLRPRAWNMIDHTLVVNGVEASGPLVDFGFLMFHVGKRLSETGSGPFFYLSKLEGYLEARLWNEVFVWAQSKLAIPVGTIKACVLIENILAAFEMEEILYELRDHSLGLNCGIWDYCASIINKFGNSADFLMPDRAKYVNMEKHYMKSYMNKVIEVSHRRGAHATSGMNAKVLTADIDNQKMLTQVICSQKEAEVRAGVDGFLIYDVAFIPALKAMVDSAIQSDNQIEKENEIGKTVEAKDLLTITKGGVTLAGLKNNIAIGILFIYHWFKGSGTFIYNGSVEDSATAEISRSQVWQWIRHATHLEDGNQEMITKQFVISLIQEVTDTLRKDMASLDREALDMSVQIFEEIVSKRDFPEFITTYLNDFYRSLQKCMHAE